MSKIGIQTHGVNHSVMRKGLKTGGRAALRFGGGRTNLLEQLGRVEAERSNPNRRAEISRVHGELNRGYKTGGRAGHAHGMTAGKRAIGRIVESLGGGEEGKPHSTRTGRRAAGTRKLKRLLGKPRRQRPSWKPHGGVGGPMVKAEGGRIGLKHGTKPWGTGPKPGTIEFLQHTTQTPKRKRKAIGGSAARTIKKGIGKALKPRGVFKKDSYKRPWEKPPQLRKSQKERREELRKKARKSGGHSKIIFADEWKHIDPGLQKGLFKKEGGRIGRAGRKKDFRTHGRDVPTMAATGGRIGFRKGGTDKKWMQKVSASIKKRGTKGKCTPITKPGCTGRAKALAKTFKKIAARRKS